MAVEFANQIVRSSSRLRALFTTALAAGAFDPAYFSVESLDAAGAAPTVLDVLAVSSDPSAAELVLSPTLADGGRYRLTVGAGLPAADLSTLAADATSDFQLGATTRQKSPKEPFEDLDALIFGRDILWSGDDWVEDAQGDLADLSGPENARQAVRNRAESDGLLWDQDFGAKLRRFVDAPSQTLSEARGVVEQQCLEDDRVDDATARLVEDDNSGTGEIQVDVVLFGGERTNVTTQVSRAQS